MTSRRILLLGNLKGTATAALEGAAKQTGGHITHVTRADDAIRELDHREWRAILVDITTPGASRFCHEARARRALFNVPLLGMTPQLTDLAFSNALRWGADDVVPLGLAAPVVERLKGLPTVPSPMVDLERGEAVVADTDRSRCDVLGRVLANAGYNVRYAMDVVSARFYLTKPGVRLFVLNKDLGNPASLIDEARTHGNQADWVVTSKRRDLGRVRDELSRFDRVAVMSSHGPPENVLFALNFLRPTTGASQRAQVRALHGTLVLFRGEGSYDDECGFTYSVSANGLYIRTLLPAPVGNLWVELEPPNSARRVRLMGRVAWSRPFAHPAIETAPAGFGVELISGLGNDLDVWVDGFNSLEAALPDAHAVPEVKFTPQPFRVPLPSSLRPEARSSMSISRASSPIIAIGRDGVSSRTSGATPSVSVQAPKEISRASSPAEPTLTAENSGAPSATFGSRETDADRPTLEAEAIAEQTWPGFEHQASLPAAPLPLDQRLQKAMSENAPQDPGDEPPRTTEISDVRWTKAATDRAGSFAPSAPASEAAPKHSVVPPRVISLSDSDLYASVAAQQSAVQESEPDSISVPALPPPPLSPTPRPAANAESTPHEDRAVTVHRAQRQAPLKPGVSRVESSTALPAGASKGRRVAAAVGLMLCVGLAIGFRHQLAPLFGPAASAEPPARSDAEGTSFASSPRSGQRAAVRHEAHLPPTTLRSASAHHEPSDEGAKPETAGAPLGSDETVSVRNTTVDADPLHSVRAPSRATPSSLPSAPSTDELKDDEVWLAVRSPLAASVFVHGINLGPTNVWLKSKCGARYLRLGRKPGDWLSDGRPEKLPCRQSLVLTVDEQEPSSD